MAVKTYKRGWGINYSDDMIRTVDNFPYWLLQSTSVVKTKNGKNTKTLNTVSAFDIETSKIVIDGEQHSFMYIWQWKLLDWVVVGREWWEFKVFLERVQEAIRDKRLIVYVHNLSYEFQFLKAIVDFKELNDKGKRRVFAVRNRKVLRAEVSDTIEFRCSYLQSNMSLARMCDTYNTHDRKLSGDEFDYDVFRTANTHLTRRELMYCVIDVVSLCQAIEKRLDTTDDNIVSIPLTSTGYVRRDVAPLTSKQWKRDNSADYDTFVLLNKAYRGGDTHANRFAARRVLENVVSVDRSSSYPAELVNKEFPLGKWEQVTATERTLDKLLNQHKAFVAEVKISDFELKDIYNTMPYISKSKCLYLSKKVVRVDKNNNAFYDFDAHFDNGRVLDAKEITIAITDVDWIIINKEYKWSKLEVVDCRTCKYKRLKKEVVDYVIKLYKGKTELKGIEDALDEYFSDKEKINSIYGMSVQHPAKQEIIYNYEGQWVLHQDKSDKELYESNVTKMPLPYAVGVWVTAFARLELRKAMWTVGLDNVIYVDTDSVKFVKSATVDEHALDDYNRNQVVLSIAYNSAATDTKGIEHHLGEYEYEHTYQYFATLGAKKYCYYDEKGKFSITIAGVNKKEGAKELEAAAKKKGLRAIDLFVDREGFVFVKAGGTEARYHDNVRFEHTLSNGEVIEITDNITLVDSTYTLGVTDEYDRLITNSIALRQALAYNTRYADC